MDPLTKVEPAAQMLDPLTKVEPAEILDAAAEDAAGGDAASRKLDTGRMCLWKKYRKHSFPIENICFQKMCILVGRHVSL